MPSNSTRSRRLSRAALNSRLIGLYHVFLRRALQHFFPDAILETPDDRSFIDLQVTDDRFSYRISDDPDGFGLAIDWFKTRYLFQPGSPKPFSAAERKLIGVAVNTLVERFRGLYEHDAVHRAERFHYAAEDVIISEFMEMENPNRLSSALEAMRVSALSTYENRRLSTGALLLGTPNDPAWPGWTNPEGAPRFNVRLTAIKGFHRLCDGVDTVFLVDREGDLARAIDIHAWAERTQGPGPTSVPCPRDFHSHAKATLSGGHICVVLTPSQEIKIFADGVMAFAFSDARWRLLGIATKFDLWCSALGATKPADLADRIFRAALNLSEDRKGALFVVLRDPAASIPLLIAAGDRIIDEGESTDDPNDLDNLSPILAKRALHHIVHGLSIVDLDLSLLEAIAGLDGAVVTDLDGRLITFGAILRVGPDTQQFARAVEGARTVAALAASFHGPVLKVSEDGYITMFLGGRRVWEL